MTIRSAFRHADNPKAIEACVWSNAHNRETDKVIRGFQEDGLPARLIGYSPNNEGVSIAVNACGKAAAGDFLFYSSDDVFLLPGWDKAMLARTRPDAWQYLTPRSVEPSGDNKSMYAPHDFGRDAETFREDELLAFWKTLKKEDVISRWGPPFVARGVWRAVGGFDDGYFPGFATDADFAISVGRRAYEVGKQVEYLGVGDAGIYHFGCITTNTLRSFAATLAANKRFQERWGMTTWQFGESVGDGLRPQHKEGKK
jgi:GT2 family glycosyltransferase